MVLRKGEDPAPTSVFIPSCCGTDSSSFFLAGFFGWLVVGFLAIIGSVKGKENGRDGALGRRLGHMAGTGDGEKHSLSAVLSCYIGAGPS